MLLLHCTTEQGVYLFAPTWDVERGHLGRRDVGQQALQSVEYEGTALVQVNLPLTNTVEDD